MANNDEIKEKAKDWCRKWNYYLDEEYLEEDGYKLPFGVCNDRAVIPLELLDEKFDEARADTSNQIFKELEKYTTSYGNILLSKAELQSLKKIFKVD
jgi:hypothetical protein